MEELEEGPTELPTIDRTALREMCIRLIKENEVPAEEACLLLATVEQVEYLSFNWWTDMDEHGFPIEEPECGCLVGSTWPEWARQGMISTKPFSDSTFSLGIDFISEFTALAGPGYDVARVVG